MEFIDNTGHIFSLQSYIQIPLGYEYEEKPYIFWINDDNHNFLSINNYYSKTIYALINITDFDINTIDSCFDIDIEINSKVYTLLNTNKFYAKFDNVVTDIRDSIDIFKINKTDEHIDLDNDMTTNKLTKDDLLFIKVDENQNGVDYTFLLVPIYVIGMVTDPGTWISNILIHTSYDGEDIEWCPISVGGEFNEEEEALTINGHNMGINLPKDILRSVYNASYYNDEFDETLYNQKVKEYLLNYMSIYGEKGNYNSAIQGLKWFGYGDKVTISKLLQTDNNFKNQYIHDFFDINNDLLESFRNFKNTTYVSLQLKLNDLTGNTYLQDIPEDIEDSKFWGEDIPELEDLMTKNIKIPVGYNNEKFEYWKPYYDFAFVELSLKLSCLEYFYNKYFLPIHLAIHSTRAQYTVFTNKLKMINETSTALIEAPINIEDPTAVVEFPKDNIIYLTHQIHFVDDIFNEYKEIDDDKDLYYINDTCANIPIKFTNAEQYYNCVLLLEKECPTYKGYIYKLNKKINVLDNLCILKSNSVISLDDCSFSYSNDEKRTYSRYYDGYDKFLEAVYYDHRRIARVYDSGDNRIYLDKVTYTNDNGEEITLPITQTYLSSDTQYIKLHDFSGIIIFPGFDGTLINPIESLEFVGPDNPDAVLYQYYVIPDFYLNIRYEDTKLSNIYIYDQSRIDELLVDDKTIHQLGIYYLEDKDKIDYFKINLVERIHADQDNWDLYENCLINFLKDTDLVYESHFQLVQHNGNAKSIYDNFVIYPKMLNKDQEFSYWVNSNFRIKLLVNNKWYTYDFTLKLHELVIDFGKLEYKYWQNKDNFITNFSQIKDLDDEHIEFNTYMHEPKLVTVNDYDFVSHLQYYIQQNHLRYVDDTIIEIPFYNYIIVDDCKVYIANLEGSFTIYKSLLDIDSPLYVINNDDVTIYMRRILEPISDLTPRYKILDEYDDSKSIDINLSNVKIYNDYNIDKIPSVISDYISEYNISPSDKYLNHVILYDIKEYQDYMDGTNLLYFHRNIHTSSNGVVFHHYGGYEDNKIVITGKQLFSTEGVLTSKIDLFDYWNKLGFVAETYSQMTYDELMSLLPDVIYEDAYDFITYRNIDNDGDFIESQPYTKDSTTNIDKTYIIDDTGLYYINFEQFKANVVDDLKNNDSLPIKYNSLTNRFELSDNIYSSTTDVFIGIEYVNDNHEVIEITNKQFIDLYNLADYDSIDDLQIKVILKYSLQDQYYLMPVQVELLGNELIDKNTGDVITTIEYDEDGNIIFDEYDEDGNPIIDGCVIACHKYTYKYRLDYSIGPDGELHRLDEPIEEMFDNPGIMLWNKDGFDMKNNDLSISIINEYNNFIQDYIKNKPSDAICQNFSQYYQQLDEIITQLESEVDLKLKDQYMSTSYTKDDDGNIIWTEKVPGYQDYINNNQGQDGGQYNMLFEEYYKNIDGELVKYFSVDDIYTYLNYLKVDISQFKGQLKLEYESNYDKLRVVAIKEYDGIVEIINPDEGDGIFTVTGTEDGVYVVFQIDEDINSKYTLDNEIYIIPKLYKYQNTAKDLAYDDRYIGDDDNKFTVYVNNNTRLEYGNNTNQATIELYKEFFEPGFGVLDTVNTVDQELYAFTSTIFDQKVNLPMFLDYDLYVMHDDKQWYALFISKEPISKIINIDDLKVPDNIKILEPNSEYNGTNYRLEYVVDQKRFLINRMLYRSTEGINHFETDDLIVCHLVNNDRLTINIKIGAKWNIRPMSIGMYDNYEIESNSEMAIISIANRDNKYEKGYYDLRLRYNIDRNVNHQYIKRAKFRVGK